VSLNKKEATKSIKENIKDAKDIILTSDIEAKTKRPNPKSIIILNSFHRFLN